MTIEQINQEPTDLPDGGYVGKLPANYGQPDCACLHCAQNKTNGNRSIINHGVYKPAGELGPREVNRVSLPGDADYAEAA